MAFNNNNLSMTLLLKNFLLLPAIILSLCLASFDLTHVHANTSEKIAQINTTINAVEVAIKTSSEITSAERLVLQDSLNDVKTAVSLIGGVGTATTTNTPVSVTPPTPDYELDYIFLTYFPEKKEVDAEIYYATSSRKSSTTVSFQLPQLAEIKNFNTEFSQMRRLAIPEIAKEIMIPQSVVAKHILFTARNPRRNFPLERNSSDVYNLVEKIGEHSMVENLTIKTGRNAGIIELTTNQEEIVRATIERNEEPATEESVKYKVGTYNYHLEVYFVHKDDASEMDHDSQTILPVINYFENEIKEEQVLETLKGNFRIVAEQKKIVDFPKKLLSFLTKNDTVYTVGEGARVDYDGARDCVSKNDQAVMKDLFLYSTQDSKIQFLPNRDVFSVIPTIKDDGMNARAYCSPVISFF